MTRVILSWLCLLFPQAWGNIIPPNQLHWQPSSGSSQISEDEFHRILDQVADFYDDPFYFLGGQLEVRRYWNSPLVSASAQQEGDDWIVSFYGGLARRPEISPDAFTLVACHEIGHHIAGFPFKNSWAANEGNADYFAAHSCAVELWQQESVAPTIQFHPRPEALCKQAYTQGPRRQLCFRQMEAGFSLAQFLAHLEKSEVSWDQVDRSVVPATYHQHPSPQCRLETFVQAALCSKPHSNNQSIPWNEAQMAKLSCHTLDGLAVGTRPACWFKHGLTAETLVEIR